VLVVHTSASAAPGRRDELVAATRAMAAPTRADRGCEAYSFAADVEDPDRVLGLEMWADEAALAEHMGHEHTREFLALVPELVAGEPVMYRWLVPDA
jgi:quinol monooxygenase YgiN